MPAVSRYAAARLALLVALSLSLGGGASGADGWGPVRVEVFTAQDLPPRPLRRNDPRGTSVAVEVYALDDLDKLAANLSDRLPTEPKVARRTAMARLGRLDPGQVDPEQLDALQRAASGLLKAAGYGIDRYPSVVFDGHAVVYGVTDLDEALRRFETRQGRALR
jgi:integrating conjugative element protein (TIGR03757 family)